MNWKLCGSKQLWRCSLGTFLARIEELTKSNIITFCLRAKLWSPVFPNAAPKCFLSYGRNVQLLGPEQLRDFLLIGPCSVKVWIGSCHFQEYCLTGRFSWVYWLKQHWSKSYIQKRKADTSEYLEIWGNSWQELAALWAASWLAKYHSSDQIKEGEFCGTCITHASGDRFVHVLFRKTWVE
jgi:hypothetical protein